VGNQCTLAAVVADPSFDAWPSGPWTGSGAVTGAMSGTGAISVRSLCETNGSVLQRVSLPPLALSEPLAVVLSARVECNGAACGNSVDASTLLVGVELGEQRTFFTGLPFAFGEKRVCLLDSAYEGGSELKLVMPRTFTCSASLNVAIEIASVDIVADASCAGVSGFANADFGPSGSTGTLDGWEAAVEYVNGPAPAPQAGTGPFGSDPSLHLQSEHPCTKMKAATFVAIPNTPALSLEFDVQIVGTPGLYVGFEGYSLVNLRTTGGVDHVSLCLPNELLGDYRRLNFFASYGGSCENIELTDIYLDNLSLEPNPACVNSGFINPSFEGSLSDLVSAWELYDNPPTTLAEVTSVPAEVHDGAQAIKMTGAASETVVFYSRFVSGGSDATGGPALTFWLSNSGASLEWYGDSFYETSTTATSGYEKITTCLDPTRTGLTEYFQLDVAFVSNADVVLLDDMTVTTDPSCPR
jgi:hypothetical protein